MDNLTVYLSATDWAGDPDAIISVNGIKVSGTLDVSAQNSTDDVNAFTFTGNFGSNPTVSVTFNNDVWNPATGIGRTVFIDGFSYNGTTLMGVKSYENYNQTQNFTLSSTPVAAARVTNLTASLGVDVHLENTSTSYGNFANVTSALGYLGIKTLRVGTPSTQPISELNQLAAQGYKMDFLIPETSSPTLLAQTLTSLDTFLAAHPGSISSIEGPNETNLTAQFSWNGQTGGAAEAAYQQALWNGVQGDAALKGIPVYALTVAGGGLSSAFKAIGSMTGDASYGNIHSYYPANGAPYQNIKYTIAQTASAESGLPMVITETNYQTAPLANGVTDAVQESYDLDLIFDSAKLGVSMTFFYELLDDKSDPNQTNAEAHYGLFNADGTPKPAAVGIHNLMTILQDNGATATSFSPTSLGYTLTGLPASGDSYLLEKSNGVFDLAVWAEPTLWNVATNSAIAATPRTVTLTLPSTVANISIFDPELGTTPITEVGNTNTVSFTVTDHPLIIQITQNLAPTVLGNGPDTLRLLLSENALNGDAQFTISVDGKQIGGTQTALALVGSGLTQEFDVAGNFGSGTHQVTITLLNPASSLSGTRDLVLASAAMDGKAITSGATVITNSDTIAFGTPQIMAQIGSAAATAGAMGGGAQLNNAVGGLANTGSLVLSQSATGGAGGASSVGAGGAGGAGGSQLSFNAGVSPLSVTASAGGGAGGNSVTQSGGAGGMASASAIAQGSAATAVASSVGGQGGSGGKGHAGGVGGIASGTMARATGTTSASATVSQIGGSGGAATGGGAGGSGAVSSLSNAVSAISNAGTITLAQTAIGGMGGSSDSGLAGSGGLATSQLTLDDTKSAMVSNAIQATVVATGGNAGTGAGAGSGGEGVASGTVTGAHAVNLQVVATGGVTGGGSGSTALATAIATGQQVQSSAVATGSAGINWAGTAVASNTSTGTSGSASASASSGLSGGNPVVSVAGNAVTAVSGVSTAYVLTESGAPAKTMWKSGSGAYAVVDALPTSASVTSLLANAPKSHAAMGATGSQILAAGEVGAGASGSASGSQTDSASADITLNRLQLTGSPDLFLGFESVQSSSGGVSNVALQVSANGNTLLTQNFTSLASAVSWFTDHPLDLGPLGSGLLAASPTLDLHVGLSVTSNLGGAFDAGFLVGTGPHG